MRTSEVEAELLDAKDKLDSAAFKLDCELSDDLVGQAQGLVADALSIIEGAIENVWQIESDIECDCALDERAAGENLEALLGVIRDEHWRSHEPAMQWCTEPVCKAAWALGAR